MTEALAEIRSLLRVADEALSRQTQPTRTPKQWDDDLDEALRAQRQAVAMLTTLQAHPVDDALVEALAPLQVEAADLEILISEIRFDEADRTERLPRLRHAG